MAVFEGNFSDTADLRLAIVVGRFNDLITTRLLQGCQDALQRHGIDTTNQVDYAWVPGSFEIPLVARQLAMSRRYDAVICLGAVIRGDTPHFDYVANESAKGIASASLQTGVPITFGVLTADNLQQALERAGVKSNKGWEYAMNAIEMATLMRSLHRSPSMISSTPVNSAPPLPPQYE
jgi:6,7-dimethyl-8-ribityllumazine synthase